MSRSGSSEWTRSGSVKPDFTEPELDPLGSLLSGSYLWFLRAFSRLLSWKHLLLLHLLLLHLLLHLLLLRLPRNAKRLRTSAALRTKVEVTMMMTVMMVLDQQVSCDSAAGGAGRL